MVDQDSRHASWRSEFESLGEEAVRMIDGGSHLVPDDRVRFSRVWLKQQEDARASTASDRRDLREEETLRISRKALRGAGLANIIALGALLLAAAAIFARP